MGLILYHFLSLDLRRFTMAKKTPDQIAAKFQRGVQAAGQDYSDGVQNPSRSWSQATQNGARRWQAGIQQAIQENRFAKGVAAAGDQKWQQAAIEKGAQRYQAAAATAAANYAQVAGQIMSAAASAQAAVANMPDETLEQRIARSAAAQRAISAAWKGRRGG
jgi:hypothetical protein